VWRLGWRDHKPIYPSWPEYPERRTARLSVVRDFTKLIPPQRKNDVFSRSPLACWADELAAAYRVHTQCVAFGAGIAPRSRGVNFDPLVFGESLIGLQEPIRDWE
jgi:hypothetical protein